MNFVRIKDCNGVLEDFKKNSKKYLFPGRNSMVIAIRIPRYWPALATLTTCQVWMNLQNSLPFYYLCEEKDTMQWVKILSDEAIGFFVCATVISREQSVR